MNFFTFPVSLWPLILRTTCLLLTIGEIGCKERAQQQEEASKLAAVEAEQSGRQQVLRTSDRQTQSADAKGSDAAARAQLPATADKILFILVDALRADVLGSYGFEQPTSPTIDKLAEESVLFERMHAASPWTAPSFGTMFTGVSPMVHGAGEMLGRRTDDGKEVHGVRVDGIGKNLPTIAELLPEKMKKIAVINNSFVCEELGFARGFDEFDYKIAHLRNYRTADVVTGRAIHWMEQYGEQSFFMLLHYFDPHIQYGPPEEYVRMFNEKRPPGIEYPFADHQRGRKEADTLNVSQRDYIRALYYGEVRFVDDQLAVLLNYLKKAGRLDDSWIVLVSDHGEELFDHGSFEHGHRYEEEVVHVPFMVRAPGGKWNAGERVHASVSHVDVLPTILGMTGATALPSHFEGRDLLPLVQNRDAADGVSYMEFNLFNGQQCAIFDGRYKLVRNLRVNNEFLYDLKKDPGEQLKLGTAHPEFVRMQTIMAEKRAALARIAKNSQKNSATLPTETGDALKSLGYIQ